MCVRRVGAAAALAVLAGGPAAGQDLVLDAPFFQPVLEAIFVENEPADGPIAPGELQGGVALSEDAALRRRLAQASRLAENDRFDDAAQALGRLAESVVDSDVFVRPEGEGQSLTSFREEVQRRIGALPPEGKHAYELAFGPSARRMLDEARHDAASLQRVATAYLHTDAGAEALYRLAVRFRDRGAFTEAATCLDRLRTLRPDAVESLEPHFSLNLAACRLRLGDQVGADSVLANLGRKNVPVTVAGRQRTNVAELSSDGLFGTLAGQNPTPGDFALSVSDTAAGEPFLVPRWSRELALSPADADELRRPPVGSPSVPVLFPTVVHGLVLLPTDGGFAAFDLKTGRLSWSYPSREAAVPSRETIWTRLAGGRLSTDGSAVFLVESESTAAAPFPSAPAVPNGVVAQQAWGLIQVQAAFMPNPAGTSTAGPDLRRLSALDVTPPRQGNLLWTVGGASGDDEQRLAGHAFLGPPLAAQGRLYAIADRSGTSRLVVLDAATGHLEWSLDLGHAEIPLAADPQRLRVGATPALAGGTLLCPTAGGAVVAVDLAGRSLRWGFRYPRLSPPNQQGWDGNAIPSAGPGGWMGETFHATAGSVLLTPPESGHLYCLDLETGEARWQRPREEHLFVASADSAHVLLVGTAGATLLRLSDGSPASPAIPFPAGVGPAGRGFTTTGSYVQPLSDETLLRVELDSGSSAVVGRLTRGIVLGNLTWHRGIMLSIGPDFLRAFDDRHRLEAEIRRKLRENPHDPAALLRRADLHADAGRYAEAIEDCRRAYEVEATDVIENRLVAALLDGLRHRLPDAAAYDAELDRLARP